jgi:hypothetical protein
VDLRGIETDDRLNLYRSSIPLIATAGADGRLILRGLPRDIVASLFINDPLHERKLIHAATTGQPQPEITLTTHIQDQTLTEKKSVYSDEFSVALKPTAHRLVGRVVFAATGKPVVGASVLTPHHAAAKSDANEKFVVENLPADEIE